MEAAQANLARCRPGFSSSVCAAHGLNTLSVVSNIHCPSVLHLLACFPSAKHVSLDMPGVGQEEVACLSQAGRMGSRLRKLSLASRPPLPGFFYPGLWSALPALRTLDLSHTSAVQIQVADLLECFAAAQRKVTVKGLKVKGMILGKEVPLSKLQAQTAALPQCRVLLASGWAWGADDDSSGDDNK